MTPHAQQAATEQYVEASDRQSRAPWFRRGKVLLLWMAVPTAAVLGTLSGGYARLGSIQDTLRYLNGERVFVHPHEVDCGEAPEGEMRKGSVSVRNETGKDLHIIGCTSSCDCISPGKFPVKIAQGGVAELPILVGYRPGKTAFEYDLQFYTDSSYLSMFRAGLPHYEPETR